MFPFIYYSEAFYIPTFFFMLMMASLSATFYAYFRAPRLGFSQVVVLDLALLFTVAAIAGGRLFHIIFEYPGYYWEHPTYVWQVWRGGFVSYGAFFGITVVGLAYLKIRRLPILDYADFVVLSMPLVILLVRIGCLGAGCCYGKPTDFFIHLVFNNPASDAGRDFLGVPLHATQLYDIFVQILIMIIIHLVYARRRFRGQVLMVFLLSYAVFRFLIEYLRGDEDRGVYFSGAISTAQYISLVTFLICAGFYLFLKKHYPISRHA